jgi:hypothetical protein
MPIEKRPSKPVAKSYIPPNFKPHKVKKGESLKMIALAKNMEPWELIYDNFKTRDPAETNWYLKNYVGCSKTTSNGMNYVFTGDDSPGIIYVPDDKAAFPSKPQTKTTPSAPLLRNVWAGIAKSHSGDLFIIGAHDLTGMIYNLGDEIPDVRNAMLNINGYKFGPGLGASIGAALVIAYGYPQAGSMNGVTGGGDFDLAIGAKLGDLLKGIKYLGSTIDTLDKYKKMRYLTENILKTMVVNGLPGSSGIITLPIPMAGVGLHAWVGFKFGDVKIWRTGKGIY